MKYLKLLIISAIAIFIQGCGSSSEDKQNSSNTLKEPVFISLNNVDLGLYDWKKPRVYPKAVIAPECNNEKIFSLRPYKNIIEVKFVDYTQPMNIYPTNYTLRAVHERDPEVVVPLYFDPQTNSWKSGCIDVHYANKLDIYPTYWIEAINANGKVATKDRVTLYNEATDNCSACHESSSGYTSALPSLGASNLADFESDYKTNILKLHDQKHTISDEILLELEQKGKSYNQAGLYETSKSFRVTCTDCHGINGVQGSGLKSLPAITNAIHDVHMNINDPNKIGSNNCLTCHPGDRIEKTFNGKIIHTMGSWWRSEDGHGEWAEDRGATSCTLCHGLDLRGSKISNNQSCYECHGNEWGSLSFNTTNSFINYTSNSYSEGNYDENSYSEYEDEEDEDDD